MVDMASRSCCAVVFYRKGVTKETIRPRLVEPYCFSVGKQDMMVKCFQLQHGESTDESGWRFFMAHKIEEVRPTSVKFRPRTKITLPEGGVDEIFTPDPSWGIPGRKDYRDYVGDALADGVVDAGERFDIEGIKQRYKLSIDDVRFVHASIYHRCLGAVLDDGFVTPVEIDQIRFLHQTMRNLGWCVGD